MLLAFYLIGTPLSDIKRTSSFAKKIIADKCNLVNKFAQREKIKKFLNEP
jgi:hypothetical protein